MAKIKKIRRVKVPEFSQQKVKKLWSEKFGDKSQILNQTTPYRSLVIYAIVFNLVLIGLVVLGQNLLPPQIPLFYGAPEGGGQLASRLVLVLPSAIALSIIFINLLLASFLEKVFLKRILMASSIITTFFSAITTIKIFFLVGSL